jgi:asparagine synthase (glutamine-hydrolysing)
MSGIVGTVRGPGRSVDLSALWCGLSELAHRGPGPPQILVFAPASGESRLLHEAERLGEPQPTGMTAAIGACGVGPGLSLPASADGRFVLVLDGRIYNAPELLLEAGAPPPKTNANQDAEALLAAFARWGVACLRRLVGMFAFALLDRTNRKLVLGRDCFGIKPLYYSVHDGLSFASQLGGLLQCSGASRRANPQRIYEFLARGRTDLGEDTLLADIRELPPGHYLEVSLDARVQPTPARYWRIPLESRTDISFDRAAEKLRELFMESVRMHLRDCGRAGSALSGGIDSSSIVAAMRAIAPDAPIHTFTFVASSPEQRFDWDEEPWADMVGRAVDARMHKIHVTPHALAQRFDALSYMQDWPFGSPVIFAQYEVFRAAREAGVDTLMSGHGADVWFGGNPRLWAASLLRHGRLWKAARFIRRTSAADHVGTRNFALAALREALPAEWRGRSAPSPRPPDFVDWTWFRERGVELATPQPIGGPSLVRSALADALVATLPSALRFEDRNAAACGIDNRMPFMTPDLAEFSFSLPEEFLVGSDGTVKAVFRHAMRGLVPEPVLARRDRQGFPVPLQQWLAELAAWVDRLIDGASGVPVLDHPHVRQAWADFRSGKARSWGATLLIWRCVLFAGWARRFNVTFD